MLGRPTESFISTREIEEKPAGNPVAELTVGEMYRYSQLLQSLFNAFTEYGIKLSGKRSFEATKIVAMAIIDQR